MEKAGFHPPLELRSSLFCLARPGGACGCRPVLGGYGGAYRAGRSGRAAGPASEALPRPFSPGMGAGVGFNGQSFTQIHGYSVCSSRGDSSGSGSQKTRAAFGPITPCSSFFLGTTIPPDIGCSLEERQIDSLCRSPNGLLLLPLMYCLHNHITACLYKYHCI